MKHINLNFNHFFSSRRDKKFAINGLPLDCLSLLYESATDPIVLIINDSSFELAAKHLAAKHLNVKKMPPIALIPPEKDCFNEPENFNDSKKNFINEAKEVFSSSVSCVPFVLCAVSGVNTPLINLNKNRNLVLSNGLSFDSCINFLDENKYTAVEMTRSKGEYSIRGGIIDVFPRVRQNPLRISFLEENLVVHSFNVDSQLTSNVIKKKIVLPSISESSLLPIKNFFCSHYSLIYLDSVFLLKNILCLNFLDFFSILSFHEFKTGSYKKVFIEHSLSSSCLLNKDGILFVPPGFVENNVTNIFDSSSPTISQINVSTIQKGDFLVHRDHGVGRFRGLGGGGSDDSFNEYVLIEYGDGEKIKIDTRRLDLINFFSNKNSENIILDSLSKKNIWKRKRASAQRAADDTVKNLLNLYVKRSKLSRPPMPAQGKIENDFLNDFSFTPTKDQDAAWKEISKDMASNIPMDRLLCGDVGFGKTELAMRAAFRCVLGNKRVVLLAPTTLLVNQLCSSFINRLSPHGVNVDMLSRFKSKKAIKSIKNNILNKNNDILIGTHALLSDEIYINNLGLLIVDEEHRFGVSQKEKIKQQKNNIDVLSMSATPIPRSMNLAVSGICSISLLQTPPLLRQPITTSIKTFNDKIIKDAMLFEVMRGGQVFFVNNDIRSISAVADKIKRWLPGLNIQILHGQESSSNIERRMDDFLNKKINVLVCTSIIEAGIDVPNANCIFINNAHLFGLAQLYQMRGRVGRSNKQAHAYLLLPKKHKPSSSALGRLKSIKKNSKLGSGYNVSQSDLEIRGGGSLFGHKQSGGGSLVGYELYIKLIQRSLHSSYKLKNNLKLLAEDVQINIYKSAHISDKYIQSDNLRFSTYKDCVNAGSKKDLDTLLNNTINRFGPAHPSFNNLINECKLKLLACEAGFSSIIKKNCGIVLNTSFTKDKDCFSSLFDFINSFFLNQNLTFHFFPKTKNILSFCIHLNSNEDKHTLLSAFLNKFKRLY